MQGRNEVEEGSKSRLLGGNFRLFFRALRMFKRFLARPPKFSDLENVQKAVLLGRRGCGD
jgi:hypothetical protein